jgi:EAL domain-containing protein (putative c-di-GMP-specific phosphodiesterase class I)
VTASIGIAVCPGDGRDAETLLRNSDMAMYRAKLNGRNNFQFCTESMNAAAARRLLIRRSLATALERDQLGLAYQPVRSSATGRVTAAEALIRWTDPELGDVRPREFIPIAEDSGLIVPIGEWVLREACRQARAWQEQGFQPIRISVNISPRQLRQHTLVATVRDILRESQLSPAYLELEITEGTLVQSDGFTQQALEALSQMGIGLVVDDFGTGYSALSYLRRFHFDRLKIDRSFLDGVGTQPDATALATAILAMAKSLELASLAEGVETEEQAAFLCAQGCDELQGFLTGAPCAASDFVRFLEREKADE